MSLNLKSLAGKLNDVCKAALGKAAGLSQSRSNFNVELEHWLLKLLEPADSDLVRVIKHYELNINQVQRELTKAVDALKTGSGRLPELSPDILDAMREAWVLATLEYGAYRIRSGHLLLAVLNDRSLSARVRSTSPELGKINGEKLKTDLARVTAGSGEDVIEVNPEGASGAGAARVPGDGKTPALDQFTSDLTASAKAGKMDPVIGRDFEIQQVIDILTRRRQNNPILAGEAGVGKTAVVEGFALRIANGDVPTPLKNVRLLSLDLGLLQAGAGVKGEFENRLKTVIEEVQKSPTPIVLFIDEAHTLIGAGASPGMGDAANLLKPALARGELRTVAATTYAEYKKSFETDPALKRRFQMVKVDEPDVAKCCAMLRGVARSLEKHHKVAMLNEAMEEGVRLSARYIPDRQLPDKAVSLLDTACARVALSQSATPPTLDDVRRQIEIMQTEIGIREREAHVGLDHEAQLKELHEKLAGLQNQLEQSEKRWEGEKKLGQPIQELRKKLEGSFAAAAQKAAGTAGKAPAPPPPLSPEEEKAARVELDRLTGELTKLQGEHPLVQPVVNGQSVAEVVAGWTGIPLGKMVRNEIEAVLKLGGKLKERVV